MTIEWEPPKKIDISKAPELSADLPVDQLRALYATLQKEYSEMRKRNIELQRELDYQLVTKRVWCEDCQTYHKPPACK